MKALADYVHAWASRSACTPRRARGPAAGTREASSTSSWTPDSSREWGFDYLKYDWCGYGSDRAEARRSTQMKKPYLFMRAVPGPRRPRHRLQPLPVRHGRRLEMGRRGRRQLLAHHRRHHRHLGQHERHRVRPGGPRPLRRARAHWNDPDMLVVGMVGWGPNLRDSRLTPNEQYTHISLWCLLCSPLLIGCDLTQLDDFTHEPADQRRGAGSQPGPAGQAGPPRRQGRHAARSGPRRWRTARSPWASSTATRSRRPSRPSGPIWDVSGKMRVRDLWRQKDLGTFDGQFERGDPASRRRPGASVPREVTAVASRAQNWIRTVIYGQRAGWHRQDLWS